MNTYIVTRHYTEDEYELFQKHKALYPNLQMTWTNGRIIYDASYEGDDYIEAEGTAKQLYIDRKDAENMAKKIGGKVRLVR